MSVPSFIVVCALPFLISACSSTSVASPPNPCGVPPAEDDWPTAKMTTVGFDGQALCQTLTQVAQGQDNVHALLVERHGTLVGEVYRTGPDLPISVAYGLWHPFAQDTAFDSQTQHDVRSVSKSVVSLLYGIALDQGKAPALDTPVLSLYPDLADLHNPQRDAIQVSHLLTMSSGLAWQEWGRGTLFSDETPMYWKASPARYLFDRERPDLPGRTFNYNGAGTATLADILSQRSGKSLSELARSELMEPLGIHQWEWVADIHGRPLAFAGLRLTPRDMLKIGRLVNNKGRWHGRQVVPEQWIEDSTRPHISTHLSLLALTEETTGYGYQWWTGHVNWRGQILDWASAMGNGGQRIFVVPKLDLTIVLTAGDYGSAAIHHRENRLISAIIEAIAAP